MACPRPASSLGSWQACCGLSVACPKPASSLLMGFGPPSNARSWPSLAEHFQALPKACAASLWPVQGLPPLSAAGRPVAASLWPVRGLPPLFLWASEGDVRHFGPPSNAPRQLAGSSLLMGFRRRREVFWTAFKLAGLLRPLCGLSEACLLSSYGLAKATLGILDRLQTLLGSRQACCGLSVACPKPASSLLMGFRRRR